MCAEGEWEGLVGEVERQSTRAADWLSQRVLNILDTAVWAGSAPEWQNAEPVSPEQLTSGAAVVERQSVAGESERWRDPSA